MARFRSEQTILKERLEQLDQTLSGLREQEAAVQKQAEVVKDELQGKQSPVERGLINRSDYTELLGIDADLLGQALPSPLNRQQPARKSRKPRSRWNACEPNARKKPLQN
jgi:chromosome segregation ATPase